MTDDSPKILFVDADENILAKLQQLLADETWSCHFVASASDALKLIAEEKFSLLVTEVDLPEDDGIQLLGEAKQFDPLLDDEVARDELRERYPFSALLIPTPYPYYMVLEQDVPQVQAMLDAPEAKIARDVAFQFGMELEPMQDGSMARFLYPLETKVALSGDRLTDAQQRPDQQRPGNWTVSFELDRKGARQFAKVTGDAVGEFLAISLDGRVKSAPRINSRIPSGSGVIEGTFTSLQAGDLALLAGKGLIEPLPSDHCAGDTEHASCRALNMALAQLAAGGEDIGELLRAPGVERRFPQRLVGVGAGDIRRLTDVDCLDHRQPRARLDGSHAFRGLGAMEL